MRLLYNTFRWEEPSCVVVSTLVGTSLTKKKKDGRLGGSRGVCSHVSFTIPSRYIETESITYHGGDALRMTDESLGR